MKIYDKMFVCDVKYDVYIIICCEGDIVLRCLRYILNLRFVLMRYSNSTKILES